MPTFSLTWAVIAFFGMLVTFLPPLQPLNWVILPWAFIGFLLNGFSLFRLFRTDRVPLAIAGFATAGVALIVCLIRATVNPGIL